MPLFRFYKGSLEDSLTATLIVHSKKELLEIIIRYLKGFLLQEDLPRLSYSIEVDPPIFDKRIGWHSCRVSLCSYDSAYYIPIGHLSEPFDEF